MQDSRGTLAFGQVLATRLFYATGYFLNGQIIGKHRLCVVEIWFSTETAVRSLVRYVKLYASERSGDRDHWPFLKSSLESPDRIASSERHMQLNILCLGR